MEILDCKEKGREETKRENNLEFMLKTKTIWHTFSFKEDEKMAVNKLNF